MPSVSCSFPTAANISDLMLGTLSRDDLRDLFPVPENFIRRKTIWLTIHPEESGREDSKPKDPTADSSTSTTNEQSLPLTSTPVRRGPERNTTPEKVVKLSCPEYVLYTDTELEHVRKQYFELAIEGKEQDCKMSKDLRCRLIRNTMTSMISILRATGDGESDRYPSKPEITAMAKRIVQYYPMLQDRDINKKNTLELDSSDSTVILDASSEGSSAPEPFDSNERDNNPADTDSLATQAKHYSTLQALWKRPNPNKESVSQLLDLEFGARRTFIDSDAIKEEDRHEKILDADNCQCVNEVKGRWAEFCQKVQFYGVWKKILKPPMGMDKIEQAVGILRALPSLFPSTSAPPKRLRDASEALVHVLEANAFLQKRPLSCPVLIMSTSNCLLAVGDRPVTTFPKEMLHEGALYLMCRDMAEHGQCLQRVMEQLETAGLKLNAEKCALRQRGLHFLGHEIDAD
ncbi:uncharacterized protein LOC118781697 [Megalops cyprinoides]|uniref:uncharacterized protein LOC118781697 n=1 Tax=Megalops cyprinoides TaxID=118141 RepID=UPI001865288A|nr:uncharacterized protein LOC118781697 [Megalops cyprinoides]